MLAPHYYYLFADGRESQVCAAGSTEVTDDVAEDLLRAADQYMLDGLKHLCEETISKQLNNDNLAEIYDLAENFNAPQLGRRCALYALEHFVVRYFCSMQHDVHAVGCLVLYHAGSTTVMFAASAGM